MDEYIVLVLLVITCAVSASCSRQACMETNSNYSTPKTSHLEKIIDLDGLLIKRKIIGSGIAVTTIEICSSDVWNDSKVVFMARYDGNLIARKDGRKIEIVSRSGVLVDTINIDSLYDVGDMPVYPRFNGGSE